METKYGGGNSTCQKCGKIIFGSIVHDCEQMEIIEISKKVVDKTISTMGKTMSAYEKRCNRYKKIIRLYQEKCNRQKTQLKKTNSFINGILHEGKLTKEEIKLYFKK